MKSLSFTAFQRSRRNGITICQYLLEKGCQAVVKAPGAFLVSVDFPVKLQDQN